jgi:hypothetical protein
MTLTQLKKYSAVGVIVSTAILLTGLGILFDVFVQNGSAIRLIIGAVPLAILIVGVLKGFQLVLDTWVDSDASVLPLKATEQRGALPSVGRRKAAY